MVKGEDSMEFVCRTCGRNMGSKTNERLNELMDDCANHSGEVVFCEKCEQEYKIVVRKGNGHIRRPKGHIVTPALCPKCKKLPKDMVMRKGEVFFEQRPGSYKRLDRYSEIQCSCGQMLSVESKETQEFSIKNPRVKFSGNEQVGHSEK